MDLALFRDTSSGPHRSNPTGSGPGERPGREPMINAPWPPLLLVAAFVSVHALQGLFPWITDRFAVRAAEVAAGGWETLVTAIFLHGNWPHALINAAMVLAFGAPLSRYMGERPVGAAAFFGFFLLSGVLAHLAFVGLHQGDYVGAVGASGAASGLMAAAARLMAGRGAMGPILSKFVLGMGAAWIGINLLVASLGSWFVPGAGGAEVGWEVHIAGFLAGLALSGPFAWLARRG